MDNGLHQYRRIFEGGGRGSRKVLDRANTIEFSDVDLMQGIDEEVAASEVPPLQLDQSFYRSDGSSSPVRAGREGRSGRLFQKRNTAPARLREAAFDGLF